MPNAKFAYVILQYGGFGLTQACADSIAKVDPQCQIVVVDNLSPDDALERLRDYAATRPQVHVVESLTNSGFSHGNNLGFAYAVERFDPDFVVVLNSDVTIEQADFVAQVERIHGETGFAVLGPDIFSPPSRRHQNPMHFLGDENPVVGMSPEVADAFERNIDQQEAAALKEQGLMGGLKDLVLKTGIGQALKRRKRASGWQQNEEGFQRKWSTRVEDVPLQGSCLVFSRRFMESMPQPFFPETFLYCEEMLLQMNCQHRGLKMVYDPAVRVNHFGGASNDMLYGDAKKTERWLSGLKILRDSLAVVRAHMRELEEVADDNQ